MTLGEASATRLGELVARQPLSDGVVGDAAIFRNVTDVPSLLGILSLEPLLILIESGGFSYRAIHVDVVIPRPPYGPPTLFFERSRLMERLPSSCKSEAVVRSSRDLLPVCQHHPEYALGAVLEDIHDSGVVDPSCLLIHLTQPHPLHTVTPEVRIPLLVRTLPIDGRLKSLPHLLDGQLVELVPPASDASGKVEVQLGPLREAGRSVPYPLPGHEHRHCRSGT